LESQASREGVTVMERRVIVEPGFQLPMTMTIRCYACGRVYDGVITTKDAKEYPCPDCGKTEVVDLGAWEKRAIAWNQKMTKKVRGGL